MARDEPQQKLFSGALAAHGRLGVHELRNCLYPGSNVAQQHSEYGMWASPTPGQVAEAQESAEKISADIHKSNETPPSSILGERMHEAEKRARDDRGREPPDLNKE